MVDLPSGSRGLGGLEPAYRVRREKEAKRARTQLRLRQGAGLGGAPVGRGYKASQGGATVERRGGVTRRAAGREKLRSCI